MIKPFSLEAIGPIKEYRIYNKRLIGKIIHLIQHPRYNVSDLVFGRKRVRVADLSELSVDNPELSFKVLEMPSPLGPTYETSIGETHINSSLSKFTIFSFL